MHAFRTLARNALSKNVRLYHHGNAPARKTMNDMPVPSGSWQLQHDANQRKYNLHLLLGVGFLAFTIFVGRSSGLLYFNYSPPAQPAPRE